MFEKTEFYLFVLAAILIGVVYYVGVKTDAGAFSSLLTNVGDTFTGRNSIGKFQAVTQ